MDCGFVGFEKEARARCLSHGNPCSHSRMAVADHVGRAAVGLVELSPSRHQEIAEEQEATRPQRR